MNAPSRYPEVQAVNELIWQHPEGRMIALGDCLDDTIRELRRRGPAVTREFAELCAKIDAIKAHYPKPAAVKMQSAEWLAVVVVRSGAVASSSSTNSAASSSSSSSTSVAASPTS